MAEPALSVVVPTRDRAPLLARCLDSLADEISSSGMEVEVVVADDSSSDATPVVLSSRPDVRSVRLPESLGSSAARNSALELARSPLVLFIDDDIVVDRGLLTRHVQHHLNHPEVEAALVGLVTWTRDAPITAHMRWLERGGPLFAFDSITDPDRVEPAHFCTANASVKRELLQRVEGPFDPRLRRFTDVELGLRLASVGMRLRYDRDAIAWHLRSDTPRTTDERMRAVGRASVALDRVHPGVAPPAGPDTKMAAIKALAAKALSPAAPLLPEGAADRIWSARAARAYAIGRREAGG